MSKNKPHFKIKLLAGNNVVLVEAPGYESEIFVPQTHKGRIAFVNVIPNRRCSLKSDRSSPSNENTFCGQSAALNTLTKRVLGCDSNGRVMRTYGGYDKYSPFGKGSLKERQYGDSSSTKHQTSSNLQTPQSLRSSAPAKNYSRVDSNLSRNCRFSAPSPQVSPLFSTLQSSAGGDATLWSRTKSKAKDKLARKLAYNEETITPTKWRKCLTPIRTYGRSSVALCKKRSPTKIGRSKVEPTQGKKATCSIDVRKRKLLIDPKTTISPQSFKLQLQKHDPSDEIKDDIYATPHFCLSKDPKTAFDLLTSPARHVSSKLKKQFRNACINKAAGTQRKYKELCNVPPLQPYGISELTTCQRDAGTSEGQKRKKIRSIKTLMQEMQNSNIRT
ncbi:uncharacterized protein LOC119636879 [Glossina fuscipes]|uniref:Uncharacterized protein LOC119636879 n=1 Tax=Glossina fuscipes TaxID=7396 RepID=A0A9C6DU33_9MUSC|nr:uncharacterized protein LOC119636879 [Glossina fuscipes]